jgi:hypothetical protein
MKYVAVALVLAGCWGASRKAPPRPTDVSPPLFAAPATIDDCRPDRLEIRDDTIDLGTRRSYELQALEWFVPAHAHKIGEVLILLVPQVDLRQNVVTLEARAYDAATETWLPSALLTLSAQPALAPRHTEITTGVVASTVLVRWTDLADRTFTKRFTPGSGTWEDTASTTKIPGPNHLRKHPAYPPKPDPTTGVTLEVNSEMRAAEFTRGGSPFGSLRFPSRPGAYIGAFAKTRTGLLWNNQLDASQAQVPAADRYASYLVHLETGAACRISRELAFPANAVFRMKETILMLNMHRTQAERTTCRPGAPCLAPEPGHFHHASLTVLRDRG